MNIKLFHLDLNIFTIYGEFQPLKLSTQKDSIQEQFLSNRFLQKFAKFSENRMCAFPKSSAVDFHALDDGFGSSDDGAENYQYFEDAIWQKPQINETIPSLTPMFDSLSISPAPPPVTSPQKILISEDEYFLENFGNNNSMQTPSHVEPIESVVVNVAHLEQFPKAASPYSATLPCIFAWFDAHTAFSSEFPTTVQNYFKVAYNLIRSHLRFFFSIAPSQDRLNNLSSVRREVPSGRVLFHYIGYGFPDIGRKHIWCSERRSREFMPFKLESLFEKLQPPTWYIFDCNNAAVVINEFKATAEKLSAGGNPDGIDWNDWLCICASGPDEELPDDPRLPRDFLSSTVLSPIKMAVICHMLQYYRLNLVNPSFPLDPPCSHLWSDKSQDSNRLSLALTAITDGIAADSLPPEIYQKIFRSDSLSAVLYRHFLLAQYLLRPYRVHPASYPEIPDLSMHPMWRQWSILLDTAICAVSIPRPTFVVDLFTRAATSFEVLMHNDQFDLIRPYHLTLLFHSLFSDATNDQPLMLLSEYAADVHADPKMITVATVFSPLFSRLMTKDPKSPVFYPLCFLILTLLYNNPSFSNDIVKEVDVSHFPNIIFNRDLPENTRIACAALVANLVVSHEKFQQICTSNDYLDQVRIELGASQPTLAVWIMLTVRRAFNLYSPDPAVFTENGLHLQCAVCSNSDSFSERAAAISVLTCFLRPFECKCNAQLLFMALPAIQDVSFLVRFHLVLLLKKFVMSFDSFSDAVHAVVELQYDSYASLLNSIFECNNGDCNVIQRIDAMMEEEDASSKAYAISIALLTMLASDPHPSVKSLAQTVIQFVSKQRAAFETPMEDYQSTPNSLSKNLNSDQYIVSYGDDEFEAEHLSFANLDQNESLHQIMLRNFVANRQDQNKEKSENEEDEESNTDVSVNEEHSQYKFDFGESPITFVDFDLEMGTFSATTDKKIYFVFRSKPSEVYSIEFDQIQIVDFKLIKNVVLFSTSDGCVHLWRPPKKSTEIIFRADSRYGGFGKLFSFLNKELCYTITNHGVISKWNLQKQKLCNETSTNLAILAAFDSESNSIPANDENGESILFVSSNGKLNEFDKKTETIKKSIECKQNPFKLLCVKQDYYLVFNDGVIDRYSNEKWEQFVKTDEKLLDAELGEKFAVLCREKNQPLIVTTDGQNQREINDVGNGVSCRIHGNMIMIGNECGNAFLYHYKD
ncbi:hypothetical protein TRFO_12867 [Tritrichomonas foetus]|uniref:Raptor N-terminal CASPase-like domain-containing protein n=1 Tax=Tritrichomonas foetus TaxID=1144522 RepID=A0A1J4KZX1_9EUKA|nr:hypothetical protein TRFO_12867 [Tritrichomonas foetus]|eukprot:OHT16801.1 hypothetical protein TRFO_12867 [Tritrichomonas foetus]